MGLPCSVYFIGVRSVDYLVGAVFFLVFAASVAYVTYAVKASIASERAWEAHLKKLNEVYKARQAAWQRLSDCSQAPK